MRPLLRYVFVVFAASVLGVSANHTGWQASVGVFLAASAVMYTAIPWVRA